MNTTPRCINIWQMKIEPDDKNNAKLFSLLSPEEQKRADHFHFDRDRQSFIVRHAFLRMLLGSYCSILPRQIQFGLGQSGKPFLAFPYNTGIQFSHAKSANKAIYAFSPDNAVGVDIEKIRPLPDLLDLARQFFSEREYATLKELFGSKRDRTFFRIWSIKEALIKAKGWSLEQGLAACVISAFPENDAGKEMLNDGCVTGCSLYAVDAGPDFVAAVAVYGSTTYEISCRQIETDPYIKRFARNP